MRIGVGCVTDETEEPISCGLCLPIKSAIAQAMLLKLARWIF